MRIINIRPYHTTTAELRQSDDFFDEYAWTVLPVVHVMETHHPISLATLPGGYWIYSAVSTRSGPSRLLCRKLSLGSIASSPRRRTEHHVAPPYTLLLGTATNDCILEHAGKHEAIV